MGRGSARGASLSHRDSHRGCLAVASRCDALRFGALAPRSSGFGHRDRAGVALLLPLLRLEGELSLDDLVNGKGILGRCLERIRARWRLGRGALRVDRGGVHCLRSLVGVVVASRVGVVVERGVCSRWAAAVLQVF